MALESRQKKLEKKYKIDFIISMTVLVLIGMMMATVIFAFIGFLLIV